MTSLAIPPPPARVVAPFSLVSPLFASTFVFAAEGAAATEATDADAPPPHRRRRCRRRAGVMALLLRLPETARALVLSYVPALTTTMLLVKRQVVAARLRRLRREMQFFEAWEERVHAQAQAACPHERTWVESDGDYHRPGYMRFCRLCHAQRPLR